LEASKNEQKEFLLEGNPGFRINIYNNLLTARMDDENMTRYCGICGSELSEDYSTDICLNCQSIMSQGNFLH
jgi:hypothetical protein